MQGSLTLRVLPLSWTRRRYLNLSPEKPFVGTCSRECKMKCAADCAKASGLTTLVPALVV